MSPSELLAREYGYEVRPFGPLWFVVGPRDRARCTHVHGSQAKSLFHTEISAWDAAADRVNAARAYGERLLARSRVCRQAKKIAKLESLL